MRAETLLWADVYDALWNRLGDGPVPLTSASVTRCFDGAGSISFEAPATDAQRRQKLLELEQLGRDLGVLHQKLREHPDKS